MKIEAKTINRIQVPGNKAEIIVYDDEIAGFGVRTHERTTAVATSLGAPRCNFVSQEQFDGPTGPRIDLDSCDCLTYPRRQIIRRLEFDLGRIGIWSNRSKPISLTMRLEITMSCARR
jgi:hypothetical protein